MSIPIKEHKSACPKCNSKDLEISSVRKAFKCMECGFHFLWTDEFRQQIWDLTRGKCIFCGVPMLSLALSRLPENFKHPQRFTIDHFNAKANGGDNHHDNLVGCCLKCNREKRSMSPRDFLIHLRRRHNPIHSHGLYKETK